MHVIIAPGMRFRPSHRRHRRRRRRRRHRRRRRRRRVGGRPTSLKLCRVTERIITR